MLIEESIINDRTSINFTYRVDESKSLIVVETIVFDFSLQDHTEVYQAIASRLCRKHTIAPLKLLLFVQEEEQWYTLEFGEFYNDKCRIYNRTKIDKNEIDSYFN